MKSKRHKNIRKNISHINKKGGFFFSKPSIVPAECDPNQLSMIKDYTEMHSKYQTCCPKGMFGKNSSPYCKQLDLNFQAAIKIKNMNEDAQEYEGLEPEDAEEIKQNYKSFNNLNKPKKWYKFWGGKKTKKRNNKKYSRRNRK